MLLKKNRKLRPLGRQARRQVRHKRVAAAHTLVQGLPVVQKPQPVGIQRKAIGIEPRQCLRVAVAIKRHVVVARIDRAVVHPREAQPGVGEQAAIEIAETAGRGAHRDVPGGHGGGAGQRIEDVGIQIGVAAGGGHELHAIDPGGGNTVGAGREPVGDGSAAVGAVGASELLVAGVQFPQSAAAKAPRRRRVGCAREVGAGRQGLVARCAEILRVVDQDVAARRAVAGAQQHILARLCVDVEEGAALDLAHIAVAWLEVQVGAASPVERVGTGAAAGRVGGGVQRTAAFRRCLRSRAQPNECAQCHGCKGAVAATSGWSVGHVWVSLVHCLDAWSADPWRFMRLGGCAAQSPGRCSKIPSDIAPGCIRHG